MSLKRFPLVCHDINVKLTIAPPPPPLLPHEDPQCFNYPPPFPLIGSQFSVVPFELSDSLVQLASSNIVKTSDLSRKKN